VLVFTLIAVLNRFGVETTSLIALLGATGLAVGLALQGTLSNVAAGVMILLFHPFKIGDTIELDGVRYSRMRLRMRGSPLCGRMYSGY
jgi:small conductance mechanosensitive channel